MYERLTDEDEEKLVAMQTTTDIDIRDTQYGREVALKEIELEAAVDHFSWEERDAMGQKGDAIEKQRKIASMEGESTDGERTRTDVLLGGKVVFVQPEKLSCRRGKIVSRDAALHVFQLFQ